MASLTGKGAATGGHTSFELFAEKGNGYGIFAALPMQPLNIPGLGVSWLDAATLLFVGSGIMPSTEHVRFATFVPKDQAFIGLAVSFQAIEFNAKTGFAMSNPCIIVLR